MVVSLCIQDMINKNYKLKADLIAQFSHDQGITQKSCFYRLTRIASLQYSETFYNKFISL